MTWSLAALPAPLHCLASLGAAAAWSHGPALAFQQRGAASPKTPWDVGATGAESCPGTLTPLGTPCARRRTEQDFPSCPDPSDWWLCRGGSILRGPQKLCRHPHTAFVILTCGSGAARPGMCRGTTFQR